MRNHFPVNFGSSTFPNFFCLLVGLVFFSGLPYGAPSLAALKQSVGTDSSASKDGSAIQTEPVIGLTYSDPVTVKWKVGVKIVAGATDARNIYIAIPVPNEWPEQTVAIESEEMPPSVGDVTYANLESGVRRQLIKIPFLPAREELELTTIFRVSTSQANAPPKTSPFLKPKAKHAAAKGYLEKSRYIAFHDSKLRKQVSSLIEGKEDAWKQVEAIYDWVRDNIDQKEMPNSDSLKTFRKKEGSEEDKIALFIAMCRSHKIPARMVWVDGGCYAEFLLVDASETAHWIPCNITGIREFGTISEPRIILQKGENIKIPEKKERQRYVAEHMRCQGTSRPMVAFVRELLPHEE